MRYLIFLLPMLLLAANPARSMDGVNTDTGDAVTVEDGTLFAEGDPLVMFDGEGNEIDVNITTVNETSTAWEIEVVNADSGEVSTIEFLKAQN